MKKAPQTAERRAAQLQRELREHDYRYYVLAEPVISDEAYDRLMKELQDLEATYPQLRSPDSPTQRVGGEPTKAFPSVPHAVPMLSLANTYTEEAIVDFDRRVRELLETARPQYMCELKFDGVSLSLTYRDGVLVRGATRGDGSVGDDITGNARTIRSIPLQLRPARPPLKNCEVRGEVILFREDFAKLNEERERDGEKLFINPRNCAAGTLKLQDSKIVASRPLRFFAYGLLGPSLGVKSHSANLEALRGAGLVVDEHAKRVSSIEEVVEFWRTWEAKRDSLPFDIDGVVVKVDSIEQQQQLGAIAKSPRWAIACKFASRKGESTVNDILLQVGRIGTITPVADLTPVFIGGTTVSRASLYNEDYIRELDIRIGDTVVVERGGDVIPKVTEVVKSRRPAKASKFRFPDVCPACGSKLFRAEEEANYYCDNQKCPAQVRARIEHWASRPALDIGGLGEMVVDRLVGERFVTNVADLYQLEPKREKLVELERWGEKSVSNLLENIERSKTKPYPRILYGLGIRHVGAGAADLLADHFATIDALMAAGEEELLAVHSIGPRIAESVVHFFRQKSTIELIARLKNAGVRLEGQKVARKGPFTGKTFVLTGTLSSMTRDEAKEYIQERGGKVGAAVSSGVNILVVGEGPGSKLEKARSLDIEIWEESTLKAKGAVSTGKGKSNV